MRGPVLALLLGTASLAVLTIVLHRHEHAVRAVEWVFAVLLTVTSLVSLVLPTQPLTLQDFWIPEMGTVSFALSRQVAALTAATYGILLATLLCKPERPPPVRYAAYLRGMSFLLIAFTVVALTVDQFLVRYVAIELVTLCTVLQMLLCAQPDRRQRSLWRAYLFLRVGDVALLASILAFALGAETFQIDAAIAAALNAPPLIRTILALWGSLAAWVKLGLPPFHGWLVEAETMGPASRLIVRCSGLPLLGCYFLFRLQPILASVAGGIPGALLGLATLLWLGIRARRRSGTMSTETWGLLVHGALAPIAAWAGFLGAYLISFVPVRFLITLITERVRVQTQPARQRRPVAQGTVTLAPQASTAAGVQKALASPEYPAPAVAALCGVSHTIERWLTQGDRTLARGTLWLADWAHHTVEGTLEGAAVLCADWIQQASGALQRCHAGRLRRNLMWATLGVLGLVVTALIIGAR